MIELEKAVLNKLRKLENKIGKLIPLAYLTKELGSEISMDRAKETIKSLEKKKLVEVPRKGFVSLVRESIITRDLIFDKINISDLRVDHLGKYLELEGRVVHISDVKPKVASVYYSCKKCRRGEILKLTGDKIFPPKVCKYCKSKKGFVEGMMKDISFQTIVLNNGINSINIELTEKLCFSYKKAASLLGKKVCAKGILKVRERTDIDGNEFTIFNWFLEGIDVNKPNFLKDLKNKLRKDKNEK